MAHNYISSFRNEEYVSTLANQKPRTSRSRLIRSGRELGYPASADVGVNVGVNNNFFRPAGDILTFSLSVMLHHVYISLDFQVVILSIFQHLQK